MFVKVWWILEHLPFFQVLLRFSFRFRTKSLNATYTSHTVYWEAPANYPFPLGSITRYAANDFGYLVSSDIADSVQRNIQVKTWIATFQKMFYVARIVLNPLGHIYAKAIDSQVPSSHCAQMCSWNSPQMKAKDVLMDYTRFAFLSETVYAGHSSGNSLKKPSKKPVKRSGQQIKLTKFNAKLFKLSEAKAVQISCCHSRMEAEENPRMI